METVIKMHDLKMKYGVKPDYVLKGVNLEVKSGQIIGYIGPNGAGKSTTVKIMLGMIKSFEGTVEIFGQDVRTAGVDYKRRIGYVPEIATIYDSLSGREYLSFIGELYHLEQDDIMAKGETLFDLFGIKASFNNRISSYSKGMKQKLLIIASLIHNPDILFFDEPITGLDANSVMIFKEIISQLAQEGKTIFYSSHIMEVVEKISDRIIVLNEGIVVADGHFSELQHANHEGSLQDIFNQLTGFHEHAKIAKTFVDTITNQQRGGNEIE